MFKINQGFELKSPQFNFDRDYFADLATLKAASEDWFPDHFITNVAGVQYILDKSAALDATTGRWRKLSATEGNGSIVDEALSTTSANPVQNKVINAALATKASNAVATTTANGLLSSADKQKLDAMASGATADSEIATDTIDGLFTE